MRNSNRGKKWAIAIVLVMICGFFFEAPLGEAVGEGRTEGGIEFKGGSGTTSTSTTSSSNNEPTLSNSPTIKKSGQLPMTGELIQPIVLLLIGWMVVFVLMYSWSLYRKSKEED